jgi:integrase
MNSTAEKILSDLEAEWESTRDSWTAADWQNATERLGLMFDFIFEEFISSQRRKPRGRPRTRIANELASNWAIRKRGRPRTFNKEEE